MPRQGWHMKQMPAAKALLLSWGKDVKTSKVVRGMQLRSRLAIIKQGIPDHLTHLWGFLTPPVAGADLRAALVASCLRGALPPVDLRAVCFVRAMAAGYPVLGIWRSFEQGFRSQVFFAVGGDGETQTNLA